jgi:hypothetical protein
MSLLHLELLFIKFAFLHFHSKINMQYIPGAYTYKPQLLGRQRQERERQSRENLSQKQNKNKRIGGIAQVEELLCSKCEVLGSVSSTCVCVCVCVS